MVIDLTAFSKRNANFSHFSTKPQCEVQIVSGFAGQFTAQPGWPKIVPGGTSRIPGP
jgi:hypothetical protein